MTIQTMFYHRYQAQQLKELEARFVLDTKEMQSAQVRLSKALWNQTPG